MHIKHIVDTTFCWILVVRFPIFFCHLILLIFSFINFPEKMDNIHLSLTHGRRRGCKVSSHQPNMPWWRSACLLVSLWVAPGLGSLIPLNVRRGAPHFFCIPHMAPAEIMHHTPLWMSPSRQNSSPAASTWSDTEGQTIRLASALFQQIKLN